MTKQIHPAIRVANKYATWVCFTLSFVFIFNLAQGLNPPDSLRMVWSDHSMPADARLQSMQQYCDQRLLRSDPDSAALLALHMLKLTDSSAQSKYKPEALRILGESQHYCGNIPEAMAYLEESLDRSIDEGYDRGVANAYYCIGNIFVEQGKYFEALHYYHKSIIFSQKISDNDAIANTYIAMGILLHDQGDASGSLALLEKALALSTDVQDFRKKGRISNNIGVIYHEQGNFKLAQEYFEKAYTLFEQAGEKRGMASALNNLGDLYNSQDKNQVALNYNMESLKMREELGDIRGIANCYNVIGDNLTRQKQYDEALHYYIKSAEIRKELGEKRAMSRVYGKLGQLYFIRQNFREGLLWCTKAFEISDTIGAKKEKLEACECLYKIHKLRGGTELALEYHEHMIQLEHELKSEETMHSLQAMEFKKIMLKDSLQKEQEIIRVEMMHQQEVTRKNKQRNIFLISGIAVLLLSAGLYSRLRYIRRSRETIKKEKERSEELLLNILPAETAAELKEKGYVKARNFDLVTVMFTDFKGFTKIAEKLSAQELINEIDFCYKAFDKIISRHGVEKIKTIGDAYMCAGGLPVANETNPFDVVNAGLEIRNFMLRLKQKRIKEGKPYFDLRIGIHTGPIIAGVVGTKKFQYDIWGDTVNIASCIESGSEAGKVNISSATYEMVKSRFKCIHRGKIDAKNKGAIDMYFVRNKA